MTIGNQQYKAKDDFTGEGLGYWYICLNFQVGWTIESESGDKLYFVTVMDFDKKHVRTHICEIICEVQLLLRGMHQLSKTTIARFWSTPMGFWSTPAPARGRRRRHGGPENWRLPRQLCQGATCWRNEVKPQKVDTQVSSSKQASPASSTSDGSSSRSSPHSAHFKGFGRRRQGRHGRDH